MLENIGFYALIDGPTEGSLTCPNPNCSETNNLIEHPDNPYKED